MADARALRVGIVGLGQMGTHHARAYAAAGVTVAAVCDADPQRAESFAQTYGAETYPDLAGLLATADLDAVSICTPPYLHLPMVRAAMAAGLDVLCEKPLAGTLDDGLDLAASLPSDRVFMLCFFHRFHEPIVKLRDLVQAGTLGRPLVLRNRFSLAMHADRRPWLWDPSRAGGGTVINTSVHSIDLFRFLVAEPQRVSARLRPHPATGRPEEDAVLVLEAEAGGAVGLLEAYSYAVRREYVFALECEDAVVEVGWTPPSLRLLRRGNSEWEEVPIEAPSSLTRIDNGVAHFLHCVRTRAQPEATAADGLRALEVARAAYQSARSDRFVACAPSTAESLAHPVEAR